MDEEDPDPESSELPWGEDLAAIEAETDQIMAGRAADAEFLARPETAELAGAVLAAEAERRGPRGPGLPGSAERVPGVSSGPAGGFGAGEGLDTAPGSAALHGFLEKAIGSGARLGEASDDEIIGLITAADRAEAAACSLKHAAVGGADPPPSRPRRRRGRGHRPGMPEAYLDRAGAEVKWALAENRPAADQVLGLAWDLEVKLPGTKALFRAGRLRHAKVLIIARETAVLDPDEARQAEQEVLGQAAGLSPGRLRNRIKRAVARVAPHKAKDRREQGAQNARVERWAEDSGNAGPGHPRGAPGAGPGRRPEDHLVGPAAPRGRDRGRDGRAARPGRPGPAPGPGLPPRRRRGTAPAEDGADHPAGPYRAPGSGGPARSRPGSPAGTTSPSRWPPCSASPTGPGSCPASARSTRGWPATWPPPPPRTRRRRGA